MSRGKSIVVTVADNALDTIQDVAERLSAKGMRVDRVMPLTGVISGSCTTGNVSKLQTVEGVASVEEDLVARLPLPGDPVQ